MLSILDIGRKLKKQGSEKIESRKDQLALKHIASYIFGSRQINFRKALILPKFLVMGWVVLFLLGYQPVMSFPPTFKQKIAKADFDQTQQITVSGFTHPFQLPHPAYLTTYFSAWHQGVDLAIGIGTPIHPINDGTVITVNYDFFGLGNYVTIQHEQGYQSLYAHMGRVYVKVGDKVTVDNIIGEVGLTGRTTGPHTHLEVSKDGVKINPLLILPAPQKMPIMTYIDNTSATGSARPVTPKVIITATPSPTPTIDLKQELSFNL